MKKIMSLATALLLIASTSFTAIAGSNVIVKGGIGVSNITFDNTLISQIGSISKESLFTNYTGFHVGVGYQTSSVLGLSLQPELLFSKQGVNMGDDESMALNYLQVPVNIQWGPNLMVVRPYLQVSPFVSYCLSGKLSIADLTNDISENISKFGYGIGLGAGIELIDKLQISAKYYWNFGQINNWSSLGSVSNWVNNVNDVKTTMGVMEISLALQF